MFVRAGTILPKQSLVQSTMETPKAPLELDIYPGEDCHGELYFDDGVHIGGPSLRQSLTCAVTPKGIALRFGARQGSYRPWWKQIAVTIHGPQSVRMTIPDHPHAGEVIIR